MTNKNELVIYHSKDGSLELNIKLENETIWLTQKQIADLYGIQRQAITKHINNIYKSKELEKISTSSKMELVQNEGGRSVTRDVVLYNLDMIICVGYRVNSKRATQFRIWATQVLKNHIVNGFTVKKDRLNDLDRLYHYLSDTLSVTVMNINKLRIESAKQKDLALLAEDIEKLKNDLEGIKQVLK